jgi:hypothetical protein
MKRTRSSHQKCMLDVESVDQTSCTEHEQQQNQQQQQQQQQEEPSLALAARSNLFGEPMEGLVGQGLVGLASGEETTTMSSTVLAPATQFPANNEKVQSSERADNTEKSNGAASSSLFGAVMKYQYERTGEELSTPSKTVRHKTNGISPGGFQLQDVIEGFGNSPFCFAKKNHFGTPASASRTSRQSSSSLDSTPRRTLEWHECTVDSRALHFMDWTIQSALELEYTPAVLQHVDAAIVQNQALCQFGSGMDVRRPGQQTTHSREHEAAVAWQASRFYWQHPSTYPLPPHMLEPAFSGTRSAKKKLVDKSASFSNSALGSNSSMPPPTRKPTADSKQDFGLMGQKQKRGIGSKDDTATSRFLETRAHEWQEAFRSLYMSWMEQIRQLNCRTRAHAENDAHLVVQQVSDLYFYATGKGHTVLFRVGVERRRETSSSHTTVPQEALNDGMARFVPEIIISSSTLKLRDKLRSMGVQLMLLDNWQSLKRGVFKEEDLTRSLQPLSTSVKLQQQDNSPSIQAELVALRRAQAFGQTVGADVSVRVHSRVGGGHSLPSRSPKRIPPLYMTGLDDCAAFFEIYYNTFGDMRAGNLYFHSKANEWPQDVPLLLCRKLGPFLHSTLKSARSTMRQTKTVAFGECASDPPASTLLSLQGYILPCAMRDIISASVNVLLANEASRDDDEGKSAVEVENMAGTHHFAIRPTAYSGEDAAGNVKPGTIGSYSSKGMNGDYSVLQQSEDIDETQYCKHDEILMLAVWDMQRSNSLAYKLAHVSTNLFSTG